jgi:hypothetical protein
MIRHEYLARPQVSAFISWLAARLDTQDSFVHSFHMRKADSWWKCDSLFSAFQRYEWKFSVLDPFSGRLLSGKSFAETADALSLIGLRIRDAISHGDHDLALAGCQAVLKWGGIRKGRYLERLGEKLIPVLKTRVRMLADPEMDLNFLPSIDMNSGWTKIYSLLVEDFAMYDSRVSAALCMLVGLFAHEGGLLSLPNELRFCQLPHRATVDRSPPYFRDQFPKARFGGCQHLCSNIMANWVLATTVRSRPSRFSALQSSGRDSWALQSALFMIGYQTSRG